MMTPVRPDVRAFFRRYVRASEDQGLGKVLGVTRVACR